MFHPEGLKDAEVAGRDAGFYGANISNCRLSLFATPELTAAWQRGNARGKADRQNETIAISAGK